MVIVVPTGGYPRSEADLLTTDDLDEREVKLSTVKLK